MLHEEKSLRSKTVFQGRLLELREEVVALLSGKEAKREIVRHPGAAAVVAVTGEGELVLVRQYRKAVEGVLLEVPAGTAKKGESWEECARRELQEETGFYAGKIKKIWEGYASPGYSSEVIHYFLAEDLSLSSPANEEDEQIEAEVVDVETCMDLLKLGKIKDNKTMIGITIADMHLKGEL
jgi:ADP-ribose pyrophosphatase